MYRNTCCEVPAVRVTLAFALIAAFAASATAVDLVYLRHEPENNQVDQYGHDGGATIPEVAQNENGRGCCGGGGSVIGIAALSGGGYVWARNDIDVNSGDNFFDSFVHDNTLTETADSWRTRGLNFSTFLGIAGLSRGRDSSCPDTWRWLDDSDWLRHPDQVGVG